MKIVIFSGGTGSKALQTGLYNIFEGKTTTVDIKIIINAYDNGLSTGLVRKVLDGRILGPSDLRKNQTLRHFLQYGKTHLYEILENRFTAKIEDVKNFVLERLLADAFKSASDYELAKSAVDTFFNFPKAHLIDYEDFSLGNIIYAGLAAQNKFSLAAAGTVMAKILGIKDNVILNSDKALYLGAATENGHLIYDEGEIVAWDNPNDKIYNTFFYDSNYEHRVPEISEEAETAITEADLIIFSAGTQWSSLIPTYQTKGVREALASSNAKQILVMNRVQDHDMLGDNAEAVLKHIGRFIDVSNVQVIFDTHAHESMRCFDYDNSNFYSFELSNSNVNKTDRTHNGERLATAIFKVYFNDYLNSDIFIFDYDDTIVGRGRSFSESSNYNRCAIRELLQAKKCIKICSCNSIKAISLKSEDSYDMAPITISVCADNALNIYDYNLNGTESNDDDRLANYSFVGSVDQSLLIDEISVESLMEMLIDIGFDPSLIENRNYASIAIKPVQNQKVLKTLLGAYIESKYGKEHYSVISSGRTTIEIHRKMMLKHAYLRQQISTNKKITYVGDEILGNDLAAFEESKMNPNVKFLWVQNPDETSLFLKTIKGAF
ncbi:MAG: 2-phospho-L-lactate transferase CofD family protein [Candidatus Nitrosotenuis sp.]